MATNQAVNTTNIYAKIARDALDLFLFFGFEFWLELIRTQQHIYYSQNKQKICQSLTSFAPFFTFSCTQIPGLRYSED